jgi:hypothetical protein
MRDFNLLPVPLPLVARDQRSKGDLRANISVRTSTELAIVCMNDLSSQSGYILNGRHFPSNLKNKIGGQVVGSRMIVLRDGDEVQVPNTPQGEFPFAFIRKPYRAGAGR